MGLVSVPCERRSTETRIPKSAKRGGPTHSFEYMSLSSMVTALDWVLSIDLATAELVSRRKKPRPSTFSLRPASRADKPPRAISIYEWVLHGDSAPARGLCRYEASCLNERRVVVLKDKMPIEGLFTESHVCTKVNFTQHCQQKSRCIHCNGLKKTTKCLRPYLCSSRLRDST